jgi:hypothetical protein
VGAPLFAIAFFTAAAVLAIWVYVRLGERAPTALSRIILHAIVALVALRGARVAVAEGVHPGELAQSILVLFGILLPALVYVFVASLWVLRTIQSATAR